MQEPTRTPQARRPTIGALPFARRQAGLTLIEFMVSIVIGMIMIAALATLIANQSSNRAEIDKSGKMIENGRYAIQTMATDLQMAGYWGELTSAQSIPASLPDPCSNVIADLQSAMALHVQGYNSPVTLSASLQVCVKNQLPGTDVLVVRRVDPDTSDIETAGVADWAKVAAHAGQVYLQTGMDSSGVQFSSVLAAATTDATADHTTFLLTKKDKVTAASPRKFIVHIYYVSKCSVEVAGSCTSADGGTPIPTLKRVELGTSANNPAFSTITIAEGIENLQVDYGLDSDNDGTPNGSDVDGSSFAVADWPNVMTVNIHLLARGLEKSSNYTDTKLYALGTAGAASAAVADQGYKRHAFVQSVRLVNPSGRRSL